MEQVAEKREGNKAKRATTSASGNAENKILEVFCPWATCDGINEVAVPMEQPTEVTKKRQIYGCGRVARFTMPVARYAGCHGEDLQSR